METVDRGTLDGLARFGGPYGYSCWGNTVTRILCSMKNITLSVDDDVLAAARRFAAEHDATVNGLVRDYLTRLARYADRAAIARRRIRELSDQSEGRIGVKTWTRDSLHER